MSLGAARLHTWKWLCAIELALTALLTLRPVAADEMTRPETWAWQPPSAARRIAWPDPRARLPVDLDPTQPLELRPGELVLVPVDVGNQLRLRGSEIRVGWASGVLESYPDVIRWLEGPAPELLRVPSFSSARFLALSAARPGQAEVRLSARREDPLAAHRLEQAVYAWLRGAGPLPSSEHPAELRELVGLRARRQLMHEALPADARARALGTEGAATWLLYARWLAQRLGERALPEPFFVQRPARLQGGHPVLPGTTEEAEAAGRLARAGETLTLDSPGGDTDVVSFSIRAQALGQTRVQLWDADALRFDSVFRVPRRGENAARWTPARVLRAVTGKQRSVRLQVLEGSIQARVEARRAEHGLFEPGPAHRPTLSFASAPPTEGLPSWLVDLVAHELTSSGATLERIERLLSGSGAALASQTAASPPNAAARAVLLDAALPELAGRGSLNHHLANFWAATAVLPRADRSALFGLLLARLHATLPDPVEITGCPSLLEDKSGVAAASDAPLLRALIESVIGIDDGKDAVAASELEALAAQNGDDPWLLEAARQTWQRSAPWVPLDAPLAPERTLQRRPFDANQPSGLCENEGARGLRWWRVPAQITEIDVLDLGGTHSGLRFLPLDPENLAASALQIDGQLIQVQPALGEASRVAVRPGKHQIALLSGPPVIARIPRAGVSPCSELLENERWVFLQSELDFELPATTAPGVASVIVDPSSLGAQGAEVEIEIAGVTATAWVRPPASGDIELSVPAGTRQLRVRANQPLLVRARLRRHPGEHRPTPPIARPSSPPEAEILARLERLTAALRTTPDPAQRATLRAARAELLHSLGYRDLAELDWQRAQQPEAGAAKSAAGALFMPDTPEAVVPLGLAARAPLLPVLEPGLAQRALALRRLGQSKASLELLRAAPAVEASSAEALLAASLASELEEMALAAQLTERLARATHNGGLYEAAAREYDRLATNEQKLDLARQAHMLAKLAQSQGVPMSSFLARYESQGSWHTPSLSALGADSVNIQAPEDEVRELSLSERVRAALMLAPSAARLFSSESAFNVQRFRDQTLYVSSSCFEREGPVEGCQTEILVDEKTVRCEAAAGDPELATPRTCPVVLDETARQLVVRLAGERRRMGWALLEQQDPAAEPGHLIPVSWQQSYTRLGSEAPIRLALGGPSILRVQARSQEAAPRPLLLSDYPLGTPVYAPAPEAAPQRVELPIPARPLRPVQAGNLRLEVSPEQRFEYVIAAAGVREITLSTHGLPLLVRPATFELSALPEPEDPIAPPAEAAPPGADGRLLAPVLRPVSELRSPWPVSLSAEAAFEDRNLADADDDASDRYLEAALVARRALIANQLWIEARGFGRLRSGPGSAGASASLNSSPIDAWPGAFASAEVVAQPEFEAAGFSANLGLRHRVDLGPRMNLLPELSATFRAVGPPRPEPGADGDVYSAYAARRPRSYDAKLVLAHRPFTDLSFRHGLGLRLNPDAQSLDRIEARSELDLLPGSGFMPWLSLAATASHRAASSLRSAAFTRFSLSPAATVWQWLGSGGRLRSDLSFTAFIDAPNPSGTQAGLFVSLVLSYDFLLGDGLEDFRTSLRPFRARLEEGGPLVQPNPVANDTYWNEELPP